MTLLRTFWQKMVVLITCGAILVLVSGCAPRMASDPYSKQVVVAPPQQQAPLEPQRTTMVPDLPAPAQMKIKHSSSYSFEGAGGRTVDYTYKGWVNIHQVHRFYVEQMPPNGWQFLTDNYRGGIYTLTFQKDRELCTVTIQKSMIFWTSARLLIQRPQASMGK